MTTTSTLRGLCVACMNAPGCTMSPRGERAVIQCAQFEPFPSRPARTITRSNPAPARSWSLTGDDRIDFYRGLCIDCENRDHCTFPKAEAGVWHCEEYI